MSTTIPTNEQALAPYQRDLGSTKKRSGSRKRACRFCSDAELQLDYKNVIQLSHFITEHGKIVPRRMTGNCAGHQREAAVAIKRARQLALLPYTEGFAASQREPGAPRRDEGRPPRRDDGRFPRRDEGRFRRDEGRDR